MSVEISTSGTLVVGESYVLVCTVTIVRSLNATSNFEWRKSDGSLVSSNAVLMFSPLFSSHGGHYICNVTVSTPYLENGFVTSAVKYFTAEGKVTQLLICVSTIVTKCFS